jgi:hypothetical protein
MKRTFNGRLSLVITALLLGIMTLPAFAQWQRWRLSPDDQSRYDSYYSRWREYRERNDRDQIVSMERRMLDVYARYNIPQDTPFWRVASNAREHRRRFEHRLSGEDQSRFNSYFSRWQDYRRDNNREQIESMERRMRDIYARYNIPGSTPFFLVASNSRDEDWDEWERRR